MTFIDFELDPDTLQTEEEAFISAHKFAESQKSKAKKKHFNNTRNKFKNRSK